MDEATRVLHRLQRIEALDGTVDRATLVDELRALVGEAEEWARAEGDARARAAARKLREEAEGMR